MDKKQFAQLKRSLELEARLHGLTNLSEKYTFFYDETNNIRKLHIRDDGRLNVPELADFVLGGVVCRGEAPAFDTDKFKSYLRLNIKIEDIKLRHIAKGEFLEIITSERLNRFLQWLSEQSLFVHHLHLDPLFWSLVDIVDSVLLQLPELQAWHFDLKSDLHKMAKADLNALVNIFARYNYPNVQSKNTERFAEDLIDFAERNRSSVPEFNFYMLKGLLQQARNMKSLEFIEGYNSKKLIECFGTFYIKKLLMFQNSKHFFDDEPQIRGIVLGGALISEKFMANVRFIDSKMSFGIQISDILCGMMGKLYTWLSQTNEVDVYEASHKLEGLSIENLDLIRLLFERSEDESKAFIHHVASPNDLEKLKLLFDR